MIKVIAINSSKRKANTFSLITQVQILLGKSDIHVEIIHLHEYDIKDCSGCEACILNDACVLEDDAAQLMDRIKNSDGIILTSPVYMEAVSGKLKTFADRTCKWFHRPELDGKPVLMIATTKGSGLPSTLKYLQRIVIQWGGIPTGRIGRNIRSMGNAVTEKECENFVRHLKADKGEYRPSLASLLNFQVQKILAAHMMGLDEAYWKDKGWDHKIYYFDCKINIFKRIIASLFYKFLNQVIK